MTTREERRAVQRDIKRRKRQGTEKRRRSILVGVRLLPEEHARLVKDARQLDVSLPELIRLRCVPVDPTDSGPGSPESVAVA